MLHVSDTVCRIARYEINAIVFSVQLLLCIQLLGKIGLHYFNDYLKYEPFSHFHFVFPVSAVDSGLD
ncbi:hypothetical protein EG68_03199 [Paragonimus skrjabini miyazakii]|uniref:Uncharacterized protein n=1 Tax=Paragonimus skrjabini miyazakii TaxID=59628 RepID=A0A8S9YFA8_9TREM|nr:hypothetical protein EG68_03199 [Paragonimus skrjabini miyazakii]